MPIYITDNKTTEINRNTFLENMVSTKMNAISSFTGKFVKPRHNSSVLNIFTLSSDWSETGLYHQTILTGLKIMQLLKPVIKF